MVKVVTVDSNGRQAEVDIPTGSGIWQTWTPVLQAGLGNPTGTYSSRVGKYFDTGKLRNFTADFDTTGLSIIALTDSVRISLPGPAANRAGDRTLCQAMVNLSGSKNTVVSAFGIIAPGTSYIELRDISGSTLLYSVFTVASLLATINWTVSGFYELP